MKRGITTSALLVAAVIALPLSAKAEEFPAGPIQLFGVVANGILRGIVSALQDPKGAKPVPVPPAPVTPAPVASSTGPSPAPLAPAPVPGPAAATEASPKTIEQRPSTPSADQKPEEHRSTSSYFGPQRPYRQQ